jgi:lipopolysaccharide assembly outer membrane protein LptD (OstA)
MQTGTGLTAKAGTTTAEAQNADWKLLQGNQTQWIVNAPAVTVDTQSGRVVFSEGVRVQSADGTRRFSADRLTYEPDTRELIGEGNPRFSQNGMVMTGKHLVVDTVHDTVHFTGGMQAQIGK